MRVGLLVAACLGGDAWAQGEGRRAPLREEPGYADAHFSKTAQGASEILLAQYAAIDPSCRGGQPPPTLTIVQPPRHGTARISAAPMYVSHPKDAPRTACNGQKAPGLQAFYRAKPGFRGHDLVILQAALASGPVREVSVAIEVR